MVSRITINVICKSSTGRYIGAYHYASQWSYESFIRKEQDGINNYISYKQYQWHFGKPEYVNTYFVNSGNKLS